LKTNSYREKPIISATYDVITVLEGERILDDGSIEALKLIHTTLPSRIQQLFEEKTRAALIKSYTVDQNKDHFTDAIQLQVVAPLQNDEKILSVTTLVLLNVTLQDHVKMNMDAMAFHSFHSPVPGFSLFIDGDLQLKQRFPFQVKDSTQKPYAKSPLLNISNVHSIEDLSFQKIISKYRSRDHLLHFDAQYPVWRSDSLQRVASRGQRQFNLDLTIRIPSVEVL
jgi:transmembrane protein 231